MKDYREIPLSRDLGTAPATSRVSLWAESVTMDNDVYDVYCMENEGFIFGLCLNRKEAYAVAVGGGEEESARHGMFHISDPLAA
ncbi:MAG: hypothetical protein MZV49_13450 [Rhodopseudomonas palustris]|nr:hypothetical protein [Rhodopseudomonas palustris]